MKITDKKYFDKYYELIGNKIPRLITNFKFSADKNRFDFLTKASAVFSSNIEGNSIDLNSFMNYELNKDKFKEGKEIIEIEDLIQAYDFAQNNELTEENMLFCHNTLSKSFLIKSKRGKYRTEKVGVFDKSGLNYLAVEPELVEKEMKLFFEGITKLIDSSLTQAEIFYFASLIHLRFAHIHPFRDGNGRVARLIEKWFVAEKSGEEFWSIPSEEYYFRNIRKYYRAINLGVNYYELNYDNCLEFLEMLPNSLD